MAEGMHEHRDAYLRWTREEFGLSAADELDQRIDWESVDLATVKETLKQILDEYRIAVLREMEFLIDLEIGAVAEEVQAAA